jgi:hypothetical protein
MILFKGFEDPPFLRSLTLDGNTLKLRNCIIFPYHQLTTLMVDGIYIRYIFSVLGLMSALEMCTLDSCMGGSLDDVQVIHLLNLASIELHLNR